MSSFFTWCRFYSADIEHIDAVVCAVTHRVGSRGVQSESGISCSTCKKTAGLFVGYLHISGKGDARRVRELTQSRPRARTWIRICLQGYRIMTVCSVVLPQIPHLDYSDKGN